MGTDLANHPAPDHAAQAASHEAPAPGRTTQIGVGQAAMAVGGDAHEATFTPGAAPDRPLPGDLRAAMERAFATSFGMVRWGESDAPARVGARAVAVGEHLYFAHGAFDPSSTDGRRLIGHELAHVVQQRAGRVPRPSGGAIAMQRDASLEDEADRAGERAAQGQDAGIAGGGGGGGAPVAQPKIAIGPEGSVERLSTLEVSKRLRARKRTVSSQDEATLKQWDRENTAFASLDKLIEALGDGGAPPIARGKAGKTEQWAKYMTAIVDDLTSTIAMLERLSAAQGKSLRATSADRDLISRGIAAAMLYQAHIASYTELTPGASTRQENPYERDMPGHYARSQADHPIYDLYRDGITQTTSHGRGEILAPYRSEVEKTFRAQTDSTSKAQKSIGVTHPKGLTIKNSGKGAHSELDAAYLGLRQSNAAAILDMVGRFVRKRDDMAKLIAMIEGTAKSSGAALGVREAQDRSPVRKREYGDVLDRVAQIMRRTDALDADGPKHDETPATDDDALGDEVVESVREHGVWVGNTPEGILVVTQDHSHTPTEEHPIKLQYAITPRRDDPHMSDSYVVRRLAQQNERADYLVAQVGALTNMRIARQSGNPNITLELIHPTMKSKQSDGYRLMIRTYLNVVIARRARVHAMPLNAQARQSFGSHDTTLADTGSAIRISVGLEPPEFHRAIAEAIRTVDGAIGNELGAAPTAAHPFYGATSKTSAKGRTTEYSAYQSIDSGFLDRYAPVQALVHGLTMGPYAQYVRNDPAATRKLDTDGGKTPAKSKGARGKALDGSLAKAEQVLAKTKTAPVKGDPASEGFPIVQLVEDTLLVTADVVHRLSSTQHQSSKLAAVRRVALREIETNLEAIDAQITQARLLRGFDQATTPSTEDPRTRIARIHNELRNATEDLLQALIILVSTTNAYMDATPEESVATRLADDTEQPTATVRTDSGEQAGAHAMLLLKKERGKKFSVGLSNERTYFEFETFLEHNKITAVGLPATKAALPSAVIIDPRPYLVAVPATGSSPQRKLSDVVNPLCALVAQTTAVPDAPPFTILIDTTNIDDAHPEIAEAIRANAALVSAERVRFVLFNSGVKHEQLSGDKFQVGRITTVGKALPGLASVNKTPMVTQLLAMMEGLRAADRAPLTFAIAPDFDITQFDRFMDLTGDRTWLDIRNRMEDARRRKASAELAEATETAILVYEARLDELVTTLAVPKPEERALALVRALPEVEQRAVHRRVREKTAKPVVSSSLGLWEPAPELAGHEGDAQAIGLPNVGNSCYISAGLNLIAFTPPYRALFAAWPPTQVDPLAAARGMIRTLCDQIHARQAIGAERLTALRQELADQDILLPPSIGERRRGHESIGDQQDPNEVFLRRLLPRFAEGVANTDLTLTQTTHTDWRNVPTERVPGADAARYSAIDTVSRQWQEAVPYMVIDVSIHDCDHLGEAVARHIATERLEDVRGTVGPDVVQGDPTRRIELGQETPAALTFALKRAEGWERDERPVHMPTVFQWRGAEYRLSAVVHHHGADIDGGHYTASTPSGADGAWEHRDDNAVSPMDDERAAARRDTGYLYSYTRQDAPTVDGAPQLDQVQPHAAPLAQARSSEQLRAAMAPKPQPSEETPMEATPTPPTKKSTTPKKQPTTPPTRVPKTSGRQVEHSQVVSSRQTTAPNPSRKRTLSREQPASVKGQRTATGGKPKTDL